jgi:hypothetical protein
MKRFSSILILAASLWASTVSIAQEHHQPGRAAQRPKAQVLEGRLIDLGCYVMDMSGTRHAKCGMQCAQKGLPVGLLEEKAGKVYTVVLPSPGLAPHLEKAVRITGTVSKENLLSPEKMEVREGEAWKAVELPPAM